MSGTTGPAIPAPPLDVRTLTLARWKDLTSAPLHMRGENLRKLDAAVEAWLQNRQSVAAMDAMRQAFRAWAAHKYRQKNRMLMYPQDFQRPVKDQLWADEPRNSRGALTALFQLLFPPELLALENGAARLGPAERAAIAWWQQEIDRRACEIFKGQRLEFRLLTPGAPKVRLTEAAPDPAERIRQRLDALAAEGQGLAGQAAAALAAAPGRVADHLKVAGGEDAALAWRAAKLGNAAHKLAELIDTSLRTMADAAHPGLSEVILKAMGLTSAEVAARLAPGLSGALSVLKGGREMGQAVLAYRGAAAVRAREELFREGAAREAVRGIATLLEAEATAKAKAGTRHLTSGTAALGLVLVDGGTVSGPAVGAATVLADLLVLAAEYVEAWKHREAVNAYLEQVEAAGRLDVGPGLFCHSPLLGAYYLLIAETSTVIALCLDRISQPGVMQEIETIVREDLPGVLEKASDLVAASHLVVPGLLSHRLHHDRTRVTRAKELAAGAGAATRGFFSRLASVACFRRALGTNPPSDPRYVGISSTEYFAQHPDQAA